jgi:deoxyribose-phosphate aldolase
MKEGLNMKITTRQLASMIDHSLLRPNATQEQLRKLCEEAMVYGFKAVCVNPIHVADAAQMLKGKEVLICSVVGFPFGTHSPETKAFETEEVIRLGAREVDMVVRVGALKEGRDREVVEDIRAVVHAAQGYPVKVILETCYLTLEEKVKGCRLSVEAGASFVKTSTGFAEEGAKVEDVRLMRETVGREFGVKAAGGIRTLADASKMIEAGANRLGTSGSVAMMKELERV